MDLRYIRKVGSHLLGDPANMAVRRREGPGMSPEVSGEMTGWRDFWIGARGREGWKPVV